MDVNILLTGLIVFIARVGDVSIGTIRTIFTVQGRTAFSFILAVVEITIWISVVSAVINHFAVPGENGDHAGNLFLDKLAVEAPPIFRFFAAHFQARYFLKAHFPAAPIDTEVKLGKEAAVYLH